MGKYFTLVLFNIHKNEHRDTVKGAEPARFTRNTGSFLAVQVIVIVIVEVPPGRASSRGGAGAAVREPEVGPEAAGLLQRLAEHLVLLDVIVRHRSEQQNYYMIEIKRKNSHLRANFIASSKWRLVISGTGSSSSSTSIAAPCRWWRMG